MSLVGELAEAVRRIYREADARTGAFSQASGLRCPTGCGRCCESPYIEASPVECLPLAESLLPRGSEWLETLRLFERRNKTLPSACPFYVSFGFGQGLCSVYEHRPLVCRLFGFAGRRDRKVRARLAICHYHRENETPLPATGEAPPLFTDFSVRTASLAPELGQPMPIARAVAIALEKALQASALGAGRQEIPGNAAGEKFRT